MTTPHNKVAVTPDAIGSHGCAQCNNFMEVYIAQGHKEVITMHQHHIALAAIDKEK